MKMMDRFNEWAEGSISPQLQQLEHIAGLLDIKENIIC